MGGIERGIPQKITSQPPFTVVNKTPTRRTPTLSRLGGQTPEVVLTSHEPLGTNLSKCVRAHIHACARAHARTHTIRAPAQNSMNKEKKSNQAEMSQLGLHFCIVSKKATPTVVVTDTYTQPRFT